MKRLRIGYVPLSDAAVLIAAATRGFAEAEGLSIEVVREVSWANIRDKLILGHFDAAHMLAPFAIATSLGLGHLRVPLIAPFALNLNGNAITVSGSTIACSRPNWPTAWSPAEWIRPIAGAKRQATTHRCGWSLRSDPRVEEPAAAIATTVPPATRSLREEERRA